MKKCLLIISISAVLLCGCSKSPESSQDASASLENPADTVQPVSLENQNNASDSEQILVAEKAMRTTSGGVTLMRDGFGNTVETRFFDNHPRIISVIVRTNANGEKTATVYGHNGDRRQLPEYKIADAFTDDANRLADVAGIWEGRKEEPESVAPLRTVVSEPMPATEPLPPTVSSSGETGKENSTTPNNNPPVADEKSPSQSETKNEAVLLNPKNSEQ